MLLLILLVLLLAVLVSYTRQRNCLCEYLSVLDVKRKIEQTVKSRRLNLENLLISWFFRNFSKFLIISFWHASTIVKLLIIIFLILRSYKTIDSIFQKIHIEQKLIVIWSLQVFRQQYNILLQILYFYFSKKNSFIELAKVQILIITFEVYLTAILICFKTRIYKTFFV